MTGIGSMRYSNGDHYRGGFKNDLFSGQGRYCYSDGDVHDGGWLKGKKFGPGIFTLASGEVVEGEWINGELCTDPAASNRLWPTKRPERPATPPTLDSMTAKLQNSASMSDKFEAMKAIRQLKLEEMRRKQEEDKKAREESQKKLMASLA
jgi:hypothetical protein